MTSVQTVSLPRFLPLFLIAIGSRIIIVVVGCILGSLPPDNRPIDQGQLLPGPAALRAQIAASSARPIEPWYRWDAGWYVNVATNGYLNARDDQVVLGGTAFLPALPLCLAAAIFLGINPFWAGLLATNLASAAGMAVFARVATRLTGDAKLGLRAFVLLIVFPTSLFFSAPYNEAFGLLFTSLALSAWLSEKPIRAGFFAALGSLSRLTGISLGMASLGGWMIGDRTWTGFKRAAILACGSFLGLILFWSYLGLVVGDPFSGIKVQGAWGRKPLSLWNIWPSIQSIYNPEMPFWGEGFTALSFLVLGIRAWIKRGAFWGILTLVPIGQMMITGTFLSGHRIVLAGLPAFIEMADLLRHRLLFKIAIVVFACIQFALLNRYVHWEFAG